MSVQQRQAGFSSYGIAVLSTVIALTVGLGLDPLLGTGDALLAFAPGILLAARFGGRKASLTATALSVLCGWFFFVPIRYSFEIADARDAGGLALLAACGLAISYVVCRSGGTSTQRRADDGRGAPFLLRAALLTGAFILLAVITQLLWADFERDRNRQTLVTHTYEVLNEVQSLITTLGEAETAERRYLLTGDLFYADQFHRLVSDQRASRTTLRRLMADNAAQTARLIALDPVIDARLFQLGHRLALRDRVGFQAALDDIRAEAGSRRVHEWQPVLHAVEQQERNLLVDRTRSSEEQAQRMRWVLGLGSALLLLMLLLAGVVIERDIYQRERARQEARLTEERLRLALDSAKAGSWEWDLKTDQNIWSPELWKLYGLEPGDRTPSYESWRAIVHPDDRELAQQVVQAAARQGTELNVEFRASSENAPARWLLSRGRPIFGPNGEAERFIGIVVDITQRKQAEEALREREQNLRQFIAAAPVAIAMFDRDMRYVVASERYRDDYCLELVELAGRSHYEVFPEIPQRWKEVHRRCLDGAVESNPGERFVRSDGSQQWVRWAIHPWRRSDDSIGGIVLFSEDITRQHDSEDAVRESEARLRLAQQIARIGTFEWNIQTGVNTWTPELEAMYGLPAGGFRGTQQAWETLVHPEDRAGAVQCVAEAFETGRFNAEWRVVRPDGTIRWLAGRAVVLRDEQERPLRLIGVNVDFTERKQAELEIRLLNTGLEERVRRRTAELEAANRELEAFAYSVSHDLRAPLRGIDGWSLALAEDYGARMDGPAREYLARVRSETQRMGHLIDDLLQLSRISRLDMQLQSVDLTAIARRIAGRLRETHPARHIEFVIEPDLQAPGDTRLLEIALDNLLQNAVKFTGPRTAARIEIGRRLGDEQRPFFVRDNGVGFDMAYAGTLFGAFQRLHKTSEFPGSGIGLAIVQRIIHRLAGNVWADAEPGQGATFYFTLGGIA